MQDQVAIVGLGTTEFSRYLAGRSPQSLALEAARKAIGDSGLSANDIDGICSSAMAHYGSGTIVPSYLQEALGIPVTTWEATLDIPFPLLVAQAAHAVFAGACSSALIVHSMYRVGDVRDDPFRARMQPKMNPVKAPFVPTDGYAEFASRYLHDYRATKEGFGLVAINDRQHASANEHAVLRTPLSMTDYLDSPIVRWPLSRLDMDMPIDGAEAVVITTAARARDLVERPVYLHAMSAGRTEHPNAMNTASLECHAQHVTVSVLRERSDLWLDDVDLLYAYDGFTIITLCWLESLGYCGPGEATGFLRQHWDASNNIVSIDGRVPMNSHGGNLSEGASQGAGDVREAVMQLRGACGDRQVRGKPTVALLAIGGIYANATATVLRAD